MASEAALVARLEARMDKYERAMKGAEETADRTLKGIENTFSSTTIGTTLGNVISKALTGAVDAALKAVGELIEKFQSLQATAALTGVTMKDAFAIDKLLGPGAIAGFEKIATLLDRMGRGENNTLKQLFDENKVKNVQDVAAAFDHVVDIIQRAGNLIQAREIGAGLGIDAATVDRIRAAGNEFGRLRQAAAAAAPDLDNIAEKAREFETMWKGALDAVKAYLVNKFHEMAVPVAEFLQTTLGEIRVLLHGIGLVGDLLKLDTTGVRNADNQVKGAVATLNDFINKRKEAASPERGPVSKPIPLGGKGGGGGETDSVTGVERFLEAQRKSTAESETQLRLLGASNVEYQTALALTQAKEAAQRDVTRGVRESADLTEAETAKIREQVTVRENAKQTVRDTIALQQFAGNMLVDSLMQATEAGAKFADVMASVAKQIARAALQALLLGQGPLAGLLGTGGGQAGQTGGLIGGLFKALPKFQTGGVVPGSGPVPIMAHGGEVVVPKAVAQSMGGGGAIQFNQTIDARGAQAGVADQIAAALAANNRALQMTLPAMIRNSQSRGALR